MTLHNVELEQAVLGAFLINSQAFYDSNLSGADFFDPVHADIFKNISKRFRDEMLVSPVTLAQDMQGHEGMKELGGLKYLSRLAGAAMSISATPASARELVDLRRKRELQEILSNSMQSLGEFTTDEIIGKIEASFIGASDGQGGVVSMMQATAKAAEVANEAHRSEGVIGVPTGIADLDRLIGGFQPSELVLLGGRPSMGKTAVALSAALATARRGNGVVISSLEMSPESLALRAVSNQTACNGRGVAYTDTKRGVMPESDARVFFESTKAVGELPIEILPASMRDIGSIYAGVKKAKRKLEGKGTPLKLIVVDYLQLISGSSKNRFDLIAEISMALKGLAMKMEVPVLALSQLSRSLESRDLNNRRPMLSDLRESGQLEQDADMVLFCYRHEYYLERETPDESDIEAMLALNEAKAQHRGKMEIICAKQRMGEIGTVHVGCNLATNFFWDLDRR